MKNLSIAAQRRAAKSQAQSDAAFGHPIRLQIPAYTDSWMKGDRYGTLVKTSKKGDKPTIAHILMDKSGKTIKVYYCDCSGI